MCLFQFLFLVIPLLFYKIFYQSRQPGHFQIGPSTLLGGASPEGPEEAPRPKDGQRPKEPSGYLLREVTPPPPNGTGPSTRAGVWPSGRHGQQESPAAGARGTARCVPTRNYTSEAPPAPPLVPELSGAQPSTIVSDASCALSSTTPDRLSFH